MGRNRRCWLLVCLVLLLSTAAVASAQSLTTIELAGREFNGVTFVPFRDLMEGMGHILEWDQATFAASAISDEGMITVRLNDRYGSRALGGETWTFDLETPVRELAETAWVPLRALVGEGLRWSFVVDSYAVPGQTPLVCRVNDRYQLTVNVEGYGYQVPVPPPVGGDRADIVVYPSGSPSPELVITNQAGRTITLYLRGPGYSDTLRLLPHSTLPTLVLSPGAYRWQATAPGVRSAQGVESFEGYHRYEWRFFIRTVRW